MDRGFSLFRCFVVSCSARPAFRRWTATRAAALDPEKRPDVFPLLFSDKKNCRPESENSKPAEKKGHFPLRLSSAPKRDTGNIADVFCFSRENIKKVDFFRRTRMLRRFLSSGPRENFPGQDILPDAGRRRCGKEPDVGSV